MPYFNSLATKYGLAKYYSEQHNSISALMWLVAGQPITEDNQTTSCYCGQAVNAILTMTLGQQYVKAWDLSGNNWLSSEYINVR